MSFPERSQCLAVCWDPSTLQHEASQWSPLHSILALLVALLLPGCATRMAPAPNLYTTGEQPLFVDLPPELETLRVEALYVTDRSRDDDGSGAPVYGYGRSSSAAYGSVSFEVGRDMSWDELVDYSTSKSSRFGRPAVHTPSIEELGRLPATPYLFRKRDSGVYTLDPEIVEEIDEANAKGREVLRSRLAQTPRKEVFLYVHGVGNDFETAMRDVAEAWHFLGREGVAIGYSWPAGSGGLFFYAYDRESGEFTIFHLKQLFEMLAGTPEVEKVHVIAHSRGTAVVMTALRELVLKTRAAGHDPRKVFKIENVLLIAPDIDFEVFSQRLLTEALGPAVGRFTLYVNAQDDAMAAANLLFDSRLRLGALQRSALSDEQQEILGELANLDIISYRGGAGGRFGHGYLRSSPAVSSDILGRLRYGWLPGEGTRRDLRRVGDGSTFWEIDDDYLTKPIEGGAK
jgi:esterase/lipase superfamily enzyme